MRAAREAVVKALEQIRSLESSKELRYLLRLACDTVRDASNKDERPTSDEVNLVVHVLKQTILTSQSKLSKAGPAYVEACMALLNSGYVPLNLQFDSPAITIPAHVTDGTLAQLSKMFYKPRTATAESPATGAAKTHVEPSAPASVTSGGKVTTPASEGSVQKSIDLIAHLLVSAVAPHMLLLSDEFSVPCLLAMQAAICPDHAVEVSSAAASLATNGVNVSTQGHESTPSPLAVVSNIHDPFVLHGDLLRSFVTLLLAAAARALPCSTMAKQVLLQVVGKLSQHVEQEKNKESGLIKIRVLDGADATDGAAVDGTPLQADLIGLLKLCVTLSIDMQVPTSTSGPHTIGLVPQRSTEMKALALNTVLQMVANGGPSFRYALSVHCALKHLVFPALLQTSLAPEPEVYRASFNIFLNVCVSFRSVLLKEISTFFTHVLFRVLDSKNTATHQKMLVLTVLQTIAEEPKNLIDIFLNYDCDTHSKNIYAELVEHIAVLCNVNKDALIPPQQQAQNSPASKTESNSSSPLVGPVVGASPQPTSPQTPSPPPGFVQTELHQAALTLFLTIANANVQWIDRFEDISAHDAPSAGPSSTSEGSTRKSFSVAADLDVLEASTAATVPEQSPQVGGLSEESSFVAHAKRVKRAHERFFALFNEDKNVDAAISFLCENTYILPEAETLGLTGEDTDEESENAAAGATVSENNSLTAAKERKRSSNILYRRLAAFLRENESEIDKLVLGEYFSKAFRKESIRKIFSSWVKRHDLRDMSLDEALRDFLGGFKLLGEAHVVDKTMELFAQWYCQQNPSAFVSANTAFVLAFSICMLNTDSHSAHVKEKMTKEGFIRNNRGIDDGKDVSPEVLSEIYDRITAKEIKLRPSTVRNTTNAKPENISAASVVLGRIPLLKHLVPLAAAVGDAVMIPVDAAGNVLFNTAQRKRAESYQNEFREALREALDVIGASRGTKDFVEASSVEHAIPMWEVTADSLVRAVGSALTDRCNAPQDLAASINASTVQKVSMATLLSGTKDVVKVCTAFGFMDHTAFLIERLFDLASVQKVVKIKKPPHSGIVIKVPVGDDSVACIVTLLEIFAELGDSLPSYLWVYAYSIISVLDAIANGVENSWRKYKGAAAAASELTNTSISMFNLFSWNTQDKPRPPNVDDTSFAIRNDILEKLRLHGDPGMWVERLFDATSHSSQGQVQMANALAQVSEKELQVGRIFSLSRLVEFVNICVQHSTRMLWRDLWSNASSVFIEAGQLAPPLCYAAIDGLKGIAFAYLARGELSRFKFQRDVLRLFEVILMKNGSEAVRLQILQALSEIVELRANQLSSGWTVILSSLSRMAVQPTLSSRSWQICEAIIQRHVGKLGECFSDFIFCLTSFSCNNTNEPEAILSASFLLACASWMHRGLRAMQNMSLTPEGVRRWVDSPFASEDEATVVRVSQAHTPISASDPLVKPAGDQRTQYHLWLSLFEGLVPIVLVHPSVRVRCHVISIVWEILSRYSKWFEESVLNSIFTSMIQPALSSIFNDASLATDMITVSVCKMRLLLHCFVRAMVVAAGRPGNAELAARCAGLLNSAAAMSAQSRVHIAGMLPLNVLEAAMELHDVGGRQEGNVFAQVISTSLALTVDRIVPQWTELHYFVDVVHFAPTTRDRISEVVLNVIAKTLVPSLLRAASTCDELSLVVNLNSALRTLSHLAVIQSSDMNTHSDAKAMWVSGTLETIIFAAEQCRAMPLSKTAVLIEACSYMTLDSLADLADDGNSQSRLGPCEGEIASQSRTLLDSITDARRHCIDACSEKSSFLQVFPLAQLRLRDGLDNEAVTLNQWKYLSLIAVLVPLFRRQRETSNRRGVICTLELKDLLALLAVAPSDLEEGTASVFMHDARGYILGDAAAANMISGTMTEVLSHIGMRRELH